MARIEDGVAYRHDQAGHTAGGRVAEPEGGDQLAGRSSGTGSAAALGSDALWTGTQSDVLVVADGAPWIWKVVADRWRGATELLDFYTPANTSGNWDAPRRRRRSASGGVG